MELNWEAALPRSQPGDLSSGQITGSLAEVGLPVRAPKQVWPIIQLVQAGLPVRALQTGTSIVRAKM